MVQKNKQMKIGIICYPTYGGSGVVATELGIGLAGKGHEVHFITYRRPARLISFHENIYYHEVSPLDYPLFEYSPYESALTSKLVEVVKYVGLDIIHVHYAIPHAAVAYMAQQILATEGKQIPVVTTLHGTDISLVGKDKSFAPIVTFSINQSNGVTAVSNALREETLAHFEISNEIEVIPNFIDFSRFKKLDKEHFKKAIAPGEEFIITHTSNFRKVKRVEDVIKVFYRLQKKVNSKLILIGDGPERSHLEGLCRDLGICDRVLFLGKQDAIEELLAVSDLFILASANESFGLSALEAMACEVPVISTNIGGLPEVNIHGVTGFTSDVGNVEEMANNAEFILSSEEVHRKFKKAALNQAKKFDIKDVLPTYETLYEKIYRAQFAGSKL